MAHDRLAQFLNRSVNGAVPKLDFTTHGSGEQTTAFLTVPGSLGISAKQTKEITDDGVKAESSDTAGGRIEG